MTSSIDTTKRYDVIHIFTSEDVDDVISCIFRIVCVVSQFVHITKGKLDVGLKIDYYVLAPLLFILTSSVFCY